MEWYGALNPFCMTALLSASDTSEFILGGLYFSPPRRSVASFGPVGIVKLRREKLEPADPTEKSSRKPFPKQCNTCANDGESMHSFFCCCLFVGGKFAQRGPRGTVRGRATVFNTVRTVEVGGFMSRTLLVMSDSILPLAANEARYEAVGFINRSEAPDTKRVGVGGRDIAFFGNVFFALLTAVPVSKWLDESNWLGSFGDGFTEFDSEFLALGRRISFPPTTDREESGVGLCDFFANVFIATFRATVGLLNRSIVLKIAGDGDRCTGTGIGTSFSSSCDGGGFNVHCIAIARACVGRLSLSMISLDIDFVGDCRMSLEMDGAT